MTKPLTVWMWSFYQWCCTLRLFEWFPPATDRL